MSNHTEEQPMYHFGGASTTLVLLPLSVIIWFSATIGNARLVLHKKRIYNRTGTASNKLFLVLLISNIIATLSAVSIHIVKLMIDYWQLEYASSCFCLLRHLVTMITIDFSLMSLTVLIIEQKDKIIKVPFGLKARFHVRNINKYIASGVLIACVPNIIMTAVYWCVFIIKGTLPCQKNLVNTSTNTTLTIVESIKKISISAPSITLIIRSINELRTTLKSQTINSDRMKRAVRKINISFLYAGAFLLFWLPFGCMAIASFSQSKEHYSTWFNIGYTVSYGYLIGIPITCALTDVNFRRNDITETSST